MYSVYALIDPRDWSVHYVGMTDNVYLRFQQHIKLQSNNAEKNEWIQSLKSEDVMVFMRTLETTSDLEEAMEREAYWIRHYTQLKMPLVNRYVPASLDKTKATPTKTRVIKVSSAGKASTVVRLFKKYPDITPTEVSRRTGVSRSYASQIRTKMRDQVLKEA